MPSPRAARPLAGSAAAGAISHSTVVYVQRTIHEIVRVSHVTHKTLGAAGIGGLCCAALLAKYGKRVTVCESHYLPGGAAHSFKVKGYTFDAGPSFHAGLTGTGSTNPLKQVHLSSTVHRPQ